MCPGWDIKVFVPSKTWISLLLDPPEDRYYYKCWITFFVLTSVANITNICIYYDLTAIPKISFYRKKSFHNPIICRNIKQVSFQDNQCVYLKDSFQTDQTSNSSLCYPQPKAMTKHKILALTSGWDAAVGCPTSITFLVEYAERPIHSCKKGATWKQTCKADFC